MKACERCESMSLVYQKNQFELTDVDADIIHNFHPGLMQTCSLVVRSMMRSSESPDTSHWAPTSGNILLLWLSVCYCFQIYGKQQQPLS